MNVFGQQKEFRKNIEKNYHLFFNEEQITDKKQHTTKAQIFLNKEMDFTPHQYRKVEEEFLQQFNLRSLEFYDQNVNNESIIQYKKLINLMQTRRKQYLKKKERFQMIRDKNQPSKVDKVVEENSEEKDKLEQDDDELGLGFYITENYQSLGKKPRGGNKKSQEISQSQTKSSRSLNRQSTLTFQSKITGSQTNQNLNLDLLQDRIYTQYNVLESLSHQQSQVQQSIFCFKRRISDLQEQLSNHNMKSKEVERLFVQNNNEMMHVKYTNQEVKSAFSKTNKHFALDLDGRKQIQQKCSQENKTNFQSSIINHISLQKMKQKINEQEKQLIYLKQKKEDLDGKEMKYQSIYVKEQQFLRTHEAIMKINPDDILKEKLVSMVDKDFQDCQDPSKSKKSLKGIMSGKKLNNLSRKSLKIFNQPINQSQPLPKIVSSLIDLYKKLKHESVQKTSEFKIILSQKQEKETQLKHLLEKINSAYDSFQHLNQPKDELDRSQLNNLIKKTNEIREKCQQMNRLTLRVEERIIFWLSKQLGLVQKIMKAFLRSDQQSMKTFKQILQKTYEVPQLYKFLRHQTSEGYVLDHQQRQLHIEDSRNMLINSFENWQDYLEYLYILHESMYIQNFISEKKLFKLFKRIIKTKLTNKHLPTEQIFQKGIQVMLQESKQYHLGKIQKLLEIFKDMNNYFDKVKTSEIQIHCSVNYESLTSIPDQNHPKEHQVNQYPTQKELIRNTLSNNKTSINQKNSPLKQSKLKSKHQKSPIPSHEMFQTFSSTQKHLQPNNLNEITMISRLKKKKHMTSLLNINGFYEQLREQMQKIQKITGQ